MFQSHHSQEQKPKPLDSMKLEHHQPMAKQSLQEKEGKRLPDATEFDEIGAPSTNGDAEFT
jgi:hypothetical protein